jgi:Peptidase of plants and bacteria/Omp85 superfamily domain/WD40-like Beta Propeller Repeat
MGIRLWTAAAVVLLTVVAPTHVTAQYFGRNKVEYVDFDFRILKTEHFDVYYYQREEAAARIAARLAERWYTRFARVLKFELATRQPLVLYGSQPEFAQTNVISGMLPDTVGGVTESARRRIVMPFAPTLTETNRILGHEIAHAFQFAIGRRHGGHGQPLWFIEGMAEYLARGTTDGEATLWLRDAVWSEKLPQRERDAARTLSPYQYGHAFWAYLAGRFGDGAIERALKPPKRSTMDKRMRHATGHGLEALYADWRAEVHRQHASRPAASAEFAATRSFNAGASSRIQLSPALSPDGRSVVVFSERDRLSLDLFLAEVESGRIIRKLATTAANARFDSLQPLRGAGAWSPESDFFAFPAVRQGHAALVVFDIEEPGRDQEFSFPALGQILSVTWSPDGKRIALSALAGGLTNLYVYDLNSGDLRQITDDPFTDLHPAWSPDGRHIAFVTDRFSTDLDVLRFGPTELASVDAKTHQVRAIETPADASYINPQWTADSRDLYFVSDLTGAPNVFRLTLADGSLHQVSNIDTGVTGLTPTSPTLSVAASAPKVAFTVYHRRKYEIAVLEGPAALAGLPHSTSAPVANGDAERPVHGEVNALLRDDLTGLPTVEPGEPLAYASRLRLERIGQPYLSSGTGAFGTFVRGGGSFLFGDMLGERRLLAAVQVANRMRDAAFEVRYLNQERRWNWGAVAELEPSIRRYRSNAVVDRDGEAALFKQADYLQRIQLHASAVVAYPINRAMRVEFLGGVRHAAYHRDVRSQISSMTTGKVLEVLREESSGGVPTTVGEVAAALVADTSVIGPTGPLLGSRYRFEIAPAAGDLTYTRVLADYRRYLMPVRPYTLALRVMHAGRYGRDGDDPRLMPSFLGSRYLVRGHSSDPRDCRPAPNEACGAELLGSRLFVGNIEMRVPVWGLLKRQIEYGPVPLDAFVFADGGVVWARRDAAGIAIAGRSVISSFGAGIRLNAGGLPFEVAAVRTLDGPKPRWSVDFGFRTGF